VFQVVGAVPPFMYNCGVLVVPVPAKGVPVMLRPGVDAAPATEFVAAPVLVSVVNDPAAGVVLPIAGGAAKIVFTNAVVASCVVFVPAAAVGAAGVPVNVGDASGAHAAQSPTAMARAKYRPAVEVANRACVVVVSVVAVTTFSASALPGPQKWVMSVFVSTPIVLSTLDTNAAASGSSILPAEKSARKFPVAMLPGKVIAGSSEITGVVVPVATST
jgi:hypothetical protein